VVKFEKVEKMTVITIPCETYCRLAKITGGDDPIFRTIRIDGGQAVASDRVLISIENIGRNSGIFHIIVDADLLAQCEIEKTYNGVLTITVVEALQYGTAVTSLGYIHQRNIVDFTTPHGDFDKWREITLRAALPVTAPFGAMYWSAAQIAKLAAASPSGRVVFESIVAVDGNRSTIMRDPITYDWLGVFAPWALRSEKIDGVDYHSPATLPSWMKAQ
jgi:hypothetical protein